MSSDYEKIPQLIATTNVEFHFRPPIILALSFAGSSLGNTLYLIVRTDLESLYATTFHNNNENRAAIVENRVNSVVFRYLLNNLWPFVLAFAVSLRVTRVTADVTDWPIE